MLKSHQLHLSRKFGEIPTSSLQDVFANLTTGSTRLN